MYISSFISPLNTMFQGDPILTHTTCAESHPCHQGTVAKRPATKAQLSQRAHDMLGFTKDGDVPSNKWKICTVRDVMGWHGMCVCLYACMYVCMYVHIYIHIYVYIHVIYTHIYTLYLYMCTVYDVYV